MTLRSNSLITTPGETADYLFSCYFTANYNQTHRDDKVIYSWAHDVQLSGGSPEKLVEFMKKSLTELYSQSFDPSGILVNVDVVEDNPASFNYGLVISMKLKTVDTGEVFDFQQQMSKISKSIDNVNQAKKSVTIGRNM